MVRQSMTPGFTSTSDHPLIGVMIQENGREVVRYFTDDEAMSEALLPGVTDAALRLFGVWADLDWDEMEAELERIRGESVPTPPIELCSEPIPRPAWPSGFPSATGET